jgi:hypothetical protein
MGLPTQSLLADVAVAGADAVEADAALDVVPPVTALLNASAAAWPVRLEAACWPALQASIASRL